MTNSLPQRPVNRISITKQELKQLVFWANVGTTRVKGGSHYPEVLETIQKYSKVGDQTPHISKTEQLCRREVEELFLWFRPKSTWKKDVETWTLTHEQKMNVKRAMSNLDSFLPKL